ncbi:MAG: T9SS type A sorting domain-containing protein [Bacteroidia bacterium]
MNILKKHIVVSLFILMIIPFVSFSQTNLSITINATNALCNGHNNGSATVTANGVAPFTYAWNTSPAQTTQTASNLGVGTYKVLVTDANNNTILDSITITQPPILTAYIDSIIVQPCFLKGGGSCGCGNTLWAVVTGGTAPYKYNWSPGGQTTDSIFNVCYVNFTVTVTDTNNCATSASLNVVIPPKPGSTLGINQVTNNAHLIVYPNPANNQITISLAEATNNTSIEMYDMLGNKVMEQKINAAIIATINVSNLAEGNYLLRVIDANGQKTSRVSISR